MDVEKSKLSDRDSDSDHMKTDQKNGQETVITNGEILTSIDPKAERRLVWKFDLKILPVLAVMVLFRFFQNPYFN
jgi:hypothetical protein